MPAMPDWLSNWLQRHQHPASLALHMIGIPLTLIALLLAGWQWTQGRWDLWYRPAALFCLGYLLQWVGHLIEGNDMGEWILVKKALNRPYTAISPRYQSPPEQSPK
jgi:hypothetical protein